MLVEAIELLVGGRADPSMVRHGATEARVDGRFVDRRRNRDDPQPGHSGRRAFPGLRQRSPRHRCLARPRSRRASVDLHGQHAHQRLLSTATQRAALDDYGDVDLEPLRTARGRLTEIDAALAALGGDERARAREIDLLRYQVDELDAANVVDPDEDEALDAEESLLADAIAHREAGAAAHAALVDDGGARDALGQRARRDSTPVRRTHEHASRLHDVVAEVDDLIAELRDTADGIDESPERLTEVRERRQVLKRSPPQVRRRSGRRDGSSMLRQPNVCRSWSASTSVPPNSTPSAARRSPRNAQAAAAVGAQRRRAAPELAAAVEAKLQRLAMPHAAVAVEVGDHADDHPGDRVQFLLAANPGAPLLPLTRVASGGELARAMLALRLVLSEAAVGDAHSDTFVFDEVDAGIGGAAAQAVGEALAGRCPPSSGARRHPPRPGRRTGRHAGVGVQNREQRRDFHRCAASYRR